jgi:hypothetical protein
MASVIDLRRLSPLRQLPARGPARIVVLVALVVGGVVAILVPVFFALILFEMLKG